MIEMGFFSAKGPWGVAAEYRGGKAGEKRRKVEVPRHASTHYNSAWMSRSRLRIEKTKINGPPTKGGGESKEFGYEE